ncbi:MAG: glycosyltransferase [Clostridia bacterium]|nr:glycosyltransferase [Clostridia bacterium]
MQFSVVVPIYKVEKYINKCIESILSQTFTDFELILVDDGSTDKCLSICDEYSKRDSRVKTIHKTNGGLVSARNAGLLEATGRYICYVDGDDWVKSDLLETIVEKAIIPYEPDMVIFGAEKIFTDHTELLVDPVDEGLYDKKALNAKIYPYMMYDNRKPFCKGLVFPVAWNKVYKRELILEHYCKDERIRMGEDNAFVFECLVSSNEVYFCSNSLYCYNKINDGSMTNSYDSNRFRNNAWLTSYIETKLGGVSQAIDEQINAFKVYWLIMAVFHEMKCGRGIVEASKHIKSAIKENDSLQGISTQKLPRTAKAYIFLLKAHLYLPTVIATKISLVIKK